MIKPKTVANVLPDCHVTVSTSALMSKLMNRSESAAKIICFTEDSEREFNEAVAAGKGLEYMKQEIIATYSDAVRHCGKDVLELSKQTHEIKDN